MTNFRSIDRQTGFLLPPSVDEWLPEKHLARFVVEVIDGLDLRAMSGSYRGSGSASYHLRMLLGILGPVEVQDSLRSLNMIQASDGTIRFDGRPMGEDGTALSGQADGPRTQRRRQPALHRSGALDRAHGQPVA